eukprot:214018-Alexandrium_andersonii.AAC.1
MEASATARSSTEDAPQPAADPVPEPLEPSAAAAAAGPPVDLTLGESQQWGMDGEWSPTLP